MESPAMLKRKDFYRNILITFKINVIQYAGYAKIKDLKE